jgi:H+/gluconate symporter-like permease
MSGESGQGTVEYIGLILLLGTVMGIVAKYTGDGGKIADTVVNKVKESIDGVSTSKK